MQTRIQLATDYVYCDAKRAIFLLALSLLIVHDVDNFFGYLEWRGF